MKVKKEICNNCGTVNAECLELRLLWIFKYYLCQKCVSIGFRSFRKDK